MDGPTVCVVASKGGRFDGLSLMSLCVFGLSSGKVAMLGGSDLMDYH